jgi:hypothetical protein
MNINLMLGEGIKPPGLIWQSQLALETATYPIQQYELEIGDLCSS